jgi:transcriptional regulator with XRE-family HTH domain
MPKLREWRKRANLTQEQLARQAGVSTSMIQKLERGETGVTVTTVRNLATVLANSVDETVNIVLLSLLETDSSVQEVL